MRDFLGYCLSWACCPLVNAVCCEDHQHCCPHNLPVCDVTAGRCLSGVGQGFDGSVPWTEKQPVNKVRVQHTCLRAGCLLDGTMVLVCLLITLEICGRACHSTELQSASCLNQH